MNYKIYLVFLSFVIMAGCYTVIKHPAVSDSDNASFQHPVYFSDDCNSCHTTDQPLLMTPQEEIPRLNYIYNNDRWYYYYESPWWSRDIFYQSGGYPVNSGDNSTLPTTSARRRFPGAGGNDQSVSNNPIGVAGSNTGSSTRIISGDSTSTSGNNSNIRQADDKSSTREGQRNSDGDQNSNVRKVDRKKK
jgi:hypothetical protein